MISQRLLAQLTEATDLGQQKLIGLLETAEDSQLPLDQALVTTGLTEERIYRILADLYELPLVRVEVDPLVARLIPESLARNHAMLPLAREGQRLVLAMADPVDVLGEDAVRQSTGFEIKRVLALRSEILAAIEQVHHGPGGIDTLLEQLPDQEATDDAEEAEEPDQLYQTRPIIRLVNRILTDGVRGGVSDIHLEPMEDTLRVRFRIDGLLRTMMELPRRVQNACLSRLKLMASLDIAERRIPQDGRIKLHMRDRLVDLRVSSLPTFFGEKIVLRVLDRSRTRMAWTDLGFSGRDWACLEEVLSSPQGMLTITGPTGSGKTSTLYSALVHLNQDHRNLVTVEDPVEYQLPGINQVPVNPKQGLTFARALRSILRQDPDVVMVGEIRDPETAEIALQAAQTGHLVLSTLHTNDAASSVVRLAQMGLPGYLIGSSLLCCVAQRLARRLCTHCRVEAAPSPRVLELVEARGVPVTGGPWFNAPGCDQCQQTGYSGRMGLYEVLMITDRLRGLILQDANSQTLSRAAREEGMRLLIEDGLEKAALGLTSLEELIRVAQVEREGHRLCATCERVLGEEFLACPFCTQGASEFCPACAKGVRTGWKCCPYCLASLI